MTALETSQVNQRRDVARKIARLEADTTTMTMQAECRRMIALEAAYRQYAELGGDEEMLNGEIRKMQNRPWWE